MSMIELAPGFAVRDDIANTHELCPACHGQPFKYRRLCGNLWVDGFTIYDGPYNTCGTCMGNRIVRSKMLCDILKK